MSPDLERLVRLQQFDTAIDDARRAIADQPQRLAEADTRLDEAARAVAARTRALDANRERRVALEKDAAVFQGRLDRFKDQLSAVKTNREYQAMQHEIATAQGELGAVEEKVLECMLDADTLAADLAREEAAFAATRAEVEAAKALLRDELLATEATLARALAERSAIVADIDSSLLALFEQVARVRRGVAICSATHDGLCSLCHVRLRPPVFQQVRHNDTIVQCETCQRILYYVPPPPPVPPPVTHPA